MSLRWFHLVFIATSVVLAAFVCAWAVGQYRVDHETQYVVIGAAAIEFFLTLGSGAGDNVSHVTHLGGMLVGYLYLRRGSWFFRARNSVSDWQRRRARRKFEVYMRKHRDEPPSRPDQWVN